MNYGGLSGGSITVEPACVGGTVRFTVSGVTDSGGETCIYSIAPVEPTYNWVMTKPDGSTAQGTGSTAEVSASEPGEYSCEFTATAARECPPSPISVGPEIKTAVEILTPDEDDVYLVGSQAEFTTTDTLGITYTWSVVQGTASPNTGTGSSFITRLESEGDIVVTLTAAGGPPCETRIQAVKPEVVEVSFDNDFDLKEWQTNDTGPMITDPVWTKTLGGAVTRNKPAAYRRTIGMDTRWLKLHIALEAAQDLTDPVTIHVRGLHDFGGPTQVLIFPVEAEPQVWPEPIIYTDSSALLDTNGAYNPMSIQWEYRVRALDGNWSGWVQMNTSTHKVYRTFDSPRFTTEFPSTWDLALEKICVEYADGLATTQSIASAANAGIDQDLCYNPSEFVPENPLNAYTSGECLCYVNARLLHLLSLNTGIPSEVRYFYGGTVVGSAKTFDHPGGIASFQTTAPAHDVAPAQAHFTYHAQTLIDGTYYDPSYGIATRASSLHECDPPSGPDTPFLEGVGFPAFPNFPNSNCGWTDTHPADGPPGSCP